MNYLLLILILIIFILVNSLYNNYSNIEKFHYNPNKFHLNDTSDWGFIILRHVSKPQHDKLWIENYLCIRNLYKDKKIVIIDDNSNYNYVSNIQMVNTVIINSEYKKRGEFLPYYYYLKYKWFDCAVIIHDGCFLNKKLDIKLEDYVTLLHFDHHHFDDPVHETTLIQSLKNNQGLLNFYNSKKWNGCFGGMSIITYNYLYKIDQKHDISRLIVNINSRHDRMCFERVISCLLHYNNKDSKLKDSLLGNIYAYLKWGRNYNYYLKHQKGKIDKPFIKVWSGR
jgi:hypothetical protein